MNFSKSIIDIIKTRTSIRTYTGQPLDLATKEKVINILKNNEYKSPFSQNAGNIRFELVSVPEFDPEEKKKLGTYGFIEGAQEFIVGAVQKSNFDREQYGFALETIILAATDMGLGTCWLGGSFNRSLFASKIKSTAKELVPAISPIGYLADRTRNELRIRKFIKADKRFPWEKLFFESDFSTPLLEDKANNYSTLLEMVRLGPSASNQQPWRIVKEINKNIFHFFIMFSEDKAGAVYNKFRRLDIGIAVSHFNLTAKELGIEGNWVFNPPEIPGSEGKKYIISWISNK